MGCEPRLTAKCGFCITGHHEYCKQSITYYEKTWTCPCEHEGETK